LPFSAMASDPAPSSEPAAATAVENLNAAEAAKRLEKAAGSDKDRIVVLDVRTPEEFNRGHLKNAKNIDFRTPEFEKSLAALDRSRPVLVHCAGGGRSTKSLELFRKLGFKSVIHLDGGYNGWKEAGLPVEKPATGGSDKDD